MRNIFKYLIAAVVLLSGTTVAHATLNNASSLSLKMNNAPAYQLAKSYWLGGADITLNFGEDEDQECKARGFTTAACPDGKVPIAYCGSSNQYHKCGCDGSVYKYSSSNCPSDSTPNGDVCDSYSSGCVCNEPGYEWSADTNSCNFYCSSNSDCGGSMVCNPSDGQCYGCLTDGDCDSGEVCNNNQCETDDKCAEVSCSGGKSCNPDNGQCECPQGQIDNDGTCEAPNCRNGGPDCSGSKPVCTDDGRCVECVSASDCGANEICSGNTCQTVDRCKDVSCSGGKSCNAANGQCECPSGTKDYGSGTCEAPNCANGGVICSEGETCNQSTKQCEAVPQTRDCQIADIKYSDKTCSPEYIPGKTPIGVVIDPVNVLMISLTEEKHNMLSVRGVSTYAGVTEDVSFSFPAFSEEGYSNTQKLMSQYYIDGAIYCRTLPNNYLWKEWYIPSTMELAQLEENGTLLKVNATLEKLSQHVSGVKTISETMWTSNELYRGNLMWAYIPALSITKAPPRFSAYPFNYEHAVRCVARYKCNGEAQCDVDSTPRYSVASLYTQSGTTTKGIEIGTSGGAIHMLLSPQMESFLYTKDPITSCPAGAVVVANDFNSDYKRCAMDTRDSGGTTDPSKTACKTGDYMYCSGQSCYCTPGDKLPPGNTANFMFMGRVCNVGTVVICNVGHAFNGPDAKAQCQNLTRQSFKNWRIIDVSDNPKHAMDNLSNPYATCRISSTGYCYKGSSSGWQPGSYNQYAGTLCCAHSYSNVYRK